MSIESITAAELDEASVEKLSSRPNEVVKYGDSPMSAKELQAAFDAMGRLNAKKYNGLVDAIASGELATALRFPGNKSLDARLSSLEDTTEEGVKLFSPVKSKGYYYNTNLYRDKDMIISYTNGKILIKQGSRVEKSKPVLVNLASFSVTAGTTYFVRTLEDIPGSYPGYSNYITDGARLRINVDYGDTGTDDTVFKLSNEEGRARATKYTSEFICFKAEKSGTAKINLSVYNNNNILDMPWYTKDINVTLFVYECKGFKDYTSDTIYMLALDETFRPRWYRHKNRTGEGLSATYSMEEIDKKISDLKKAIVALGGSV